MIELAFVACMKAMMHLCEERSIAYLPDVSLRGCMAQAQPQLAEWAAAHPDLQVTRWTCQRSGAHGMKA
jgi:hypothetical protein